MPTVHDKSLRAELQAFQDKLEALRKAGKVPPELDTLLQALMPLLTLLLTVLLEKTTRKTSRNSSIPPSQMEAEDETARRAKSGRKANPAEDRSSSTLQRVTTEETLTVAACDSCGADLSDVAPTERERRYIFLSIRDSSDGIGSLLVQLGQPVAGVARACSKGAGPLFAAPARGHWTVSAQRGCDASQGVAGQAGGTLAWAKARALAAASREPPAGVPRNAGWPPARSGIGAGSG